VTVTLCLGFKMEISKSLRIRIPNVITHQEANHLVSTARRDWNITFLESTPPVVNRVLDSLREHFEFELTDNSYWRLQDTPEAGVWWHKDVGSHGHMSWCKFGVSVLLTEECGGRFKYRKDGIEETINDRETFDALVHSSDWEHMVEAPDPGATRTVLLFFI